MKPEKHRTSSVPADWDVAWPNTPGIDVNTLKDEAKAEYVGWIDLMGAKGWMAGSIRRAAEIVGLIHLAAIRAARPVDASVYPVIDGVYVTSPNKNAFRNVTHQTMRILARTFQERTDPNRFLVRGGVAYGRVLHGKSIAGLHDDLVIEKHHSRCMAIGASIRQAYEAEKLAPPFGFYVDMTARSVASGEDSPYTSAYDRWWSRGNKQQKQVAELFGEVLDEHFGYLAQKHREIEYPLDRLTAHRLAAAEYFRLKATGGASSPTHAAGRS